MRIHWLNQPVSWLKNASKFTGVAVQHHLPVQLSACQLQTSPAALAEDAEDAPKARRFGTQHDLSKSMKKMPSVKCHQISHYPLETCINLYQSVSICINLYQSVSISKHLPPDALQGDNETLQNSASWRWTVPRTGQLRHGCPANSAGFNMKRGAISCHQGMKF